MILNMTSRTDFWQLVALAWREKKNQVPVVLEMLEDNLTPVLAYLTLRRTGSGSFLYESVIGGERTARYSFLGVKPFQSFAYRDGQIQILDRNGIVVTNDNTDPKIFLADELERFSMLTVPGLPPFAGGLVGNIGYDAVRLVEPQIKDENPDELGLPDINLMYFDSVIAFDHVAKKIYLIKLVKIEAEASVNEANYLQATEQLDELHEQLLSPRLLDLVPGQPTNGITSNFTQAEFEAMVKRCQEYITAGDAFQIVVSQRFSCPLTVEAFVIYRCLRHTNPSPYLFFLDFGAWQMIGSSPEILVNVKDREVSICPIAGTRPRGKNDVEDDQLAAELLADNKECAEHLMLIDLARNDIGRVAAFGTVEVPRRMFIEKYSTVMHIVSEVTGKLRQELSPLDALWTSVPAGTLSGAPKIRAMEIIEELEPTRRGPYGGCVGFLGFDGNIETAIVIRTAIATNNRLYWQAGAGIVYDSDPAKEYLETCQKGKSILRSLVMAGNTKDAS